MKLLIETNADRIDYDFSLRKFNRSIHSDWDPKWIEINIHK